MWTLACWATVAAEEVPDRYVVEPGDTLTGIAGRFGVDAAVIAAANGLEDPDLIVAGRALLVPSARGKPPAAAAAPDHSNPRVDPAAPDPPNPTIGAAPPDRPNPTIGAAPPDRPNSSVDAAEADRPARRRYEVQPGDTIPAIARRFGVTVEDIFAANRLPTTHRIFVGDYLLIERAAAVRTLTASPATAVGTQPGPGPAIAVRAQPSPGRATAIVSIATQNRGAPYLYAGTTPDGFDCSGFVYFVFTSAGSSISRDIWEQYQAGSHPGRSQLQPGDLVFFENTYVDGLSHNGIYLGNGRFIHAVDEDTGVAVSSLTDDYWATRWFGATRID